MRNADVLQLDMAAKPQTKPKTAFQATPKPVSARRAPAKTGYINARVEPKLKENAEAVLDKIGMTTTDAVTLFLTQVVAHKGMPFPVKIPNRETIRAMKDIEKGRTESFAGTAEELFDHILGKKLLGKKLPGKKRR